MANWGESRNSVRFFLGLQNHCGWWLQPQIKRCLLIGRKAMTNLDSIFKSKDITLPTKTHLVKAMVFPVVTYRCGSWTIKKAEHWRIDVFKLWRWRRLLSPLDSKEIKPVNPKGNQPWILNWKDWCWSSNTLATWCKELTHLKRPWCWERLRAEEKGVTEDEVVGWHHWLNRHESEQMQETVKDRES